MQGAVATQKKVYWSESSLLLQYIENFSWWLTGAESELTGEELQYTTEMDV
jgi:hypothetical protein